MTSYIIKHYIFHRTLDYEYAIEGKNEFNFKYVNGRLLKRGIPAKINSKSTDLQFIDHISHMDLQRFKKFAYKRYDDSFSALFKAIVFKKCVSFKKWLFNRSKIFLPDRDSIFYYENYEHYSDLQFIMEIYGHENFKCGDIEDIRCNVMEYLYKNKYVELYEVGNWMHERVGFVSDDEKYNIIDFICKLQNLRMKLFMRGILYSLNYELLSYALIKSNFIVKNEVLDYLIQNNCCSDLQYICAEFNNLNFQTLSNHTVYHGSENTLRIIDKYCDLYKFINKNDILRSETKISQYLYDRTSSHPDWEFVIRNPRFQGFYLGSLYQ